MEYSYHIIKDFGPYLIFWWPSTSGEYCTDPNKAKEEFDREVKDNKQTKFKLVKYKAVLDFDEDGSYDVVGVIGEWTLIEEYNPNIVQ